MTAAGSILEKGAGSVRGARGGAMTELAILAGRAGLRLAHAIASACGTHAAATRFEVYPDGEIGIEVGPVRGADVYVIQPTATPVHDSLFELLLLTDAARRAGAARLTAVIPYLGYSRQDRRSAEGAAVGGRVVADAIGAAADRVVVVDLHAPAMEGFFGRPLDDLDPVPFLIERIRPLARDHVVVAPDLGAVKRAERFAAALALPVACVRKRRLSGSEVEATGVEGDVRGRPVLIVDDMISTGATVAAAAAAVRAAGAAPGLLVVATHGVFSPPAADVFPRLDPNALLVTDSVPTASATGLATEIVTIGGLLADAITRLHCEEPLRGLVRHA